VVVVSMQLAVIAGPAHLREMVRAGLSQTGFPVRYHER